MSVLVDRLVAAVGDDRCDAGLAIRAQYRPAGGGDGRVMPPTFPEGPYLTIPRRVDGFSRVDVIIDQHQSQANRLEAALLAAHQEQRIALPMFALTCDTPQGPRRWTSLEFPHRFADAYLRDSEVDGVRFDKSVPGQRLRSATPGDVRPLFEREPLSLLLGAWDSHRKGGGLKLAHAYQSDMYGRNWEPGSRMAGRYDPVNLSGSIDDKAKAEDDWQYFPPGDKKPDEEKRLSKIGHGHIKPGEAPGGGWVSVIDREAVISSARLEQLEFGDAGAEAAQLARATLMALGLAGDRLAFGKPSMWLRSGCDLVKYTEKVGFEGIGGAIDEITATAAEAVAAFDTLRQRTAEAGIVMATDTIEVTPTKALRDAIVYATTKATGSQE